MNMKKLFSSLGLAAVVVTSAYAQGPAVIHRTFNFINNGTYMVVSNNATWDFDTAFSTYFVPFQYGTNVFAGTTNGNFNAANGAIWPLAVVDAFAGGLGVPFCDANGGVMANASISISTGASTNYPLPAGMLQWPNLAFNSLTNVPTAIVATNASSTNFITMTFTKSVDGINFGTDTASKFVVGFQLAASTYQTFTTNLPAYFTTGTRKIRLKSIATSNSTSSPGVIFNAIALGAYIP